MPRNEWVKLYDDLLEVFFNRKDVLEMSMSQRAVGKALGLLSRDVNGKTRLSRKGKALIQQTLG